MRRPGGSRGAALGPHYTYDGKTIYMGQPGGSYGAAWGKNGATNHAKDGSRSRIHPSETML